MMLLSVDWFTAASLIAAFPIPVATTIADGDASIKAPPNGLGRLTIKIALRQRSQFLICCFFLFEVLSQK